jgi:spore cortex formation protein SpoVR/YcgB (stage V sporulation)
MTVFGSELRKWQTKIEATAKRRGLNFYPIVFDVVDWESMAEVASYKGLPDHFSHWKFGEAYVRMRKSFTYGLSKIYELVFNADPAIAFLLEENKLVDQKLVMAHVCAHVDFFKNNAWFEHTNREMPTASRAAGERIDNYRAEHGEEVVDQFLTDCMKIENLIDHRISLPGLFSAPGKAQDRKRRKKGEELYQFRSGLPYLEEFLNPPDWIQKQRRAIEAKEDRATEIRKGLRFPARPVRDVLLFLLQFAPLEDWQRDILDIVRQESAYFVPQGMTKIANEGWASFWHSELMVRRGMATSAEIVDYAQHNAGTLGSPGFNPYKLGLLIYLDIEYRWDTGRHGILWERLGTSLEGKRQWDDFVVFKKIYEETGGDVAAKWAEWCAFKNGCERGLAGFPRDLFAPERLVKWWCEYEAAEENLAVLEAELKNASSELIEDIVLDIRWNKTLLGLKQAWRSREREGGFAPPPERFRRLAEQHPGRVPLGEGRRKIFEVRRRINDHALIDEFFTKDLFEALPIFSYAKGGGGVSAEHWGVDQTDFDRVKRKLLFGMFNSGDPVIELVDARYGETAGSPHGGRGLYLKHRHEGADLKLDEMRAVLKVIYKMWRHPVYLETIVTEERRGPSLPPWVLHQMGVRPVREQTKRHGVRMLFFTLDGERILEHHLDPVAYPAPY